MWLSLIYMMTTVVMGAAALFKGAIYPGIAGIAGPSSCWFAASGLKGSMLVGTRSQKVGGFAMAIVFAGAGFAVVSHSGYWVTIFGAELSGSAWCAIGLVVGYVATSRKHAVG